MVQLKQFFKKMINAYRRKTVRYRVHKSCKNSLRVKTVCYRSWVTFTWRANSGRLL